MSRIIKFRAWHTQLNIMLQTGDYWFPDVDNKAQWHQKTCYPIIVTSAGILYQKKIVTDPCGWVDVHDAQGHLTSYYANWEELRITSNDLILELFTGIKDINDKDIYEGDIVTASDEDEPIYWTDKQGQQHVHPDCGTGSVEWLTREAMWYICGEVQNALGEIYRNRTIKVIGNIHQNGDLLK